MLSNSRVDFQWPDETFNVCVQAIGGRMDRPVDIKLTVLSDNPSVLSLFHYEPLVTVYQPGQNVCTTIRIVGNDTETLEVAFAISSEDPGVLFHASNQLTHVVFTGKLIIIVCSLSCSILTGNRNVCEAVGSILQCFYGVLPSLSTYCHTAYL